MQPGGRLPSHVEVIVNEQRICFGNFYEEIAGFSAELVDDEGVTYPCGTFDAVETADAALRQLAKQLSNRVNVEQVLEKFMRKGARFLVTYESASGKYAIVAGYPPARYEDTGLRFESQDEAKGRLDAKQQDQDNISRL